MARRDVLCLFDVDGTLTPSRLVRRRHRKCMGVVCTEPPLHGNCKMLQDMNALHKCDRLPQPEGDLP